MNINKIDKAILNCYLELPIPAYIKTGQVNGLDLMLCYEDVCNRIYELINFNEINTKKDSWNEDVAFIFDENYELGLLEIIKSTNNCELKIHSLLTLTVLQILTKHIK